MIAIGSPALRLAFELCRLARSSVHLQPVSRGNGRVRVSCVCRTISPRRGCRGLQAESAPRTAPGDDATGAVSARRRYHESKILSIQQVVKCLQPFAAVAKVIGQPMHPRNVPRSQRRRMCGKWRSVDHDTSTPSERTDARKLLVSSPITKTFCVAPIYDPGPELNHGEQAFIICIRRGGKLCQRQADLRLHDCFYP